MALELGSGDLDKIKKGVSGGSSSGGSELDLINGVNSFMKGLNQAIGNAQGLMGSYSQLKEKLVGQQQSDQFQPAPQIQHRQATPDEPVESASRGVAVTKTENKVIEVTENKREKAEGVFKELHGQIKPFLPLIKGMNAGELVAMAMQPDKKEKIIQEIEKRL